MEVYRATVHLQPLPLFNLEGLQARLMASPQFLLWSFLALTLTFSSHEFYRGSESEAIKFYARSAADTVMRLAAEGIPRLEILQSLCLLAFRDIKGKS